MEDSRFLWPRKKRDKVTGVGITDNGQAVILWASS